uniref:Uncharacterized protein n=1 Tax=Timema poppense TaxID=170557 RepID=A0A7R9DW32_TIMPO|nr:unnamed protein product [Timema poppensis]
MTLWLMSPSYMLTARTACVMLVSSERMKGPTGSLTTRSRSGCTMYRYSGEVTRYQLHLVAISTGSPFHPKIVDPAKVRVIGGWESFTDAEGRLELAVHTTKKISLDTLEAGPGEYRPVGHGNVVCRQFGGWAR